ncbi:MAG: hypothetical protein V1837_01235 [Candidatus Woesearchaeota archaeon]
MEEAIKILKKYTGHKTIILTESGDTAIFAAMYCARKLGLGKPNVLIPDQGGWLTYKKYPKMLELNAKEYKTELGIVRINELETENSCCLIYENPTGYFAEQPTKQIYEKCKDDCLVIADVTGCIGDEELCNGTFADIMVGSFGKWKPVNLGYGGFVSFKREEDYLKAKEIFNTTSFDESRLNELAKKLEDCRQRLDYLYKKCRKVKSELKNHEVLHRDKKGINVAVRFKTEIEKQELIEYCENNKYEYTLCPRYIRVLEQAISIEIKRL